MVGRTLGSTPAGNWGWRGRALPTGVMRLQLAPPHSSGSAWPGGFVYEPSSLLPGPAHGPPPGWPQFCRRWKPSQSLVQTPPVSTPGRGSPFPKPAEPVGVILLVPAWKVASHFQLWALEGPRATCLWTGRKKGNCLVFDQKRNLEKKKKC